MLLSFILVIYKFDACSLSGIQEDTHAFICFQPDGSVLKFTDLYHVTRHLKNRHVIHMIVPFIHTLTILLSQMFRRYKQTKAWLSIWKRPRCIRNYTIQTTYTSKSINGHSPKANNVRSHKIITHNASLERDKDTRLTKTPTVHWVAKKASSCACRPCWWCLELWSSSPRISDRGRGLYALSTSHICAPSWKSSSINQAGSINMAGSINKALFLGSALCRSCFLRK